MDHTEKTSTPWKRKGITMNATQSADWCCVCGLWLLACNMRNTEIEKASTKDDRNLILLPHASMVLDPYNLSRTTAIFLFGLEAIRQMGDIHLRSLKPHRKP